MATPSELSLREIRQYLLDNGGIARNRDLVKHFKRFLTEPETRVEARNNFKEYVNILASIKNEEGEKYLVLKKKYRETLSDVPSPIFSHLGQGSPLSTPDLSTPSSPVRDPPPYRPPPPAPLSPVSDYAPACELPANRIQRLDRSCESADRSWPNVHDSMSEMRDEHSQESVEPVEDASALPSPPVPPRRKSQDKLRIGNKENMIIDRNKNGQEAAIKEDESSTTTAVSMNAGSAELLSVRERMQRFNRMASETDLHGKANGTPTPTKKRSDKQQGTDEDDRASVVSQLDGKSREWLVRAAQGDYQALAKLAAEEPRLTRLKDPSSTALHWGAKHGDENIVKLIAGTYKDYGKGVNETTNGGYTPLHIAMQFDHENIFNLLVQVYGASQEIRDHSGKKARQYLVSKEAAVSQDTFRQIKSRKKHTERDLGFLRIGSLNVRVKRTTEAFSQFLGVASGASSNEKIHKTWGSADNVQEGKNMPPPKYAPIKKRRSRRAQDFVSPGSRSQQTQVIHAASQPSTPLPQIRKNLSSVDGRPSSTSSITMLAMPMTGPSLTIRQNDSDSDGACGFDSAWRGSAQI